MNKFLTAYEAALKYKLTISYMRRFAREGRVEAREARTSQNTKIWLIDEESLRKYLQTRRKPGRPSKAK